MLDPWHPKEGEFGYRFVKWFTNNINWCHGYYYESDVPKPDNKLYNLCYKYWLFPFKQCDCLCCNTVRGLIYGFILGWILGGL